MRETFRDPTSYNVFTIQPIYSRVVKFCVNHLSEHGIYAFNYVINALKTNRTNLCSLMSLIHERADYNLLQSQTQICVAWCHWFTKEQTVICISRIDWRFYATCQWRGPNFVVNTETWEGTLLLSIWWSGKLEIRLESNDGYSTVLYILYNTSIGTLYSMTHLLSVSCCQVNDLTSLWT